MAEIGGSGTSPERALGLPPARRDLLAAALVGAMAFLAALAIAGGVAVGGLAARWERGAGALLIVQVPEPAAASPAGGARLEAALQALREVPGVARAAPMPAARLAALLDPWLGPAGAALPLPAVIEITAGRPRPDPAALAAALARTAPGAAAEDQGQHVGPLLALARSLALLAAWVVLVVGLVAAAMVAFAVHAALGAHRPTIELLHAMGATESWIAAAFARRAGRLALAGAAAGALAALPVLVGLAALAAPLAAPLAEARAGLGAAPLAWLPALVIPGIAWAMARASAALTVRRWLARLW